MLPAQDLILDGEAVVADSRGIPDFGLLHADLAAGRKERLLYHAFDLLYLDGLPAPMGRASWAHGECAARHAPAGTGLVTFPMG